MAAFHPAGGPSGPRGVDATPSAALLLGRTIVPPGVRVTWSQRNDKVVVTVELPDFEAPCISFADSGLVSLDATSTRSGEALAVRLQCMHRIDAAQCRCIHGARHSRSRPAAPAPDGVAHSRLAGHRRWMATDHSIRLVLQKLAIARWDRLTEGERLASITIDWSQWMDEEEENAVRHTPLGHDVFQMKGAMGARFGSNLERDLAARRQAQALDTSKGCEDDEDDEITLC